MIKRIMRDRRLTVEEAAKYAKVREQVTGELPDLVQRHLERNAANNPLRQDSVQPKDVPEQNEQNDA
jgi:hypothetical protein